MGNNPFFHHIRNAPKSGWLPLTLGNSSLLLKLFLLQLDIINRIGRACQEWDRITSSPNLRWYGRWRHILGLSLTTYRWFHYLHYQTLGQAFKGCFLKELECRSLMRNRLWMHINGWSAASPGKVSTFCRSMLLVHASTFSRGNCTSSCYFFHKLTWGKLRKHQWNTGSTYISCACNSHFNNMSESYSA